MISEFHSPALFLITAEFIGSQRIQMRKQNFEAFLLSA